MICVFLLCFFFFFKQKTAYEVVSGDWSSDVCSSDLGIGRVGQVVRHRAGELGANGLARGTEDVGLDQGRRVARMEQQVRAEKRLLGLIEENPRVPAVGNMRCRQELHAMT